jgi:hypothetical protein
VGGIVHAVGATSLGARKYFHVWSNQAVWTATASESWFTVTPSTGPGKKLLGSLVTVTIKPNPSAYARSGYVEINAGSAAPYRIYVGQLASCKAKPILKVEPDSLSVGAGTSKSDVLITTDAPNGWTATSSSPWLTVTPTSGASGEYLTITWEANATGQTRVGTVVIRAGKSPAYNLKVTQAG